MDYPLSPSDQSKLPPPQLPEPQQTGTPATPPQVTGPQPSEQPGPPSPLLGKAPPLPLSLPMAERARKNPALLQEWQKGLNPVTNKPAPSPAIHGSGGKPPVGGSWSLGPSAPGFPPLSNPLLLTDGTVIAHEVLHGDLVEAHTRLHGQLYKRQLVADCVLAIGLRPAVFLLRRAARRASHRRGRGIQHWLHGGLDQSGRHLRPVDQHMDRDNASLGLEQYRRRAVGRARQRDLYAGQLLHHRNGAA